MWIFSDHFSWGSDCDVGEGGGPGEEEASLQQPNVSALPIRITVGAARKSREAYPSTFCSVWFCCLWDKVQSVPACLCARDTHTQRHTHSERHRERESLVQNTWEPGTDKWSQRLVSACERHPHQVAAELLHGRSCTGPWLGACSFELFWGISAIVNGFCSCLPESPEASRNQEEDTACHVAVKGSLRSVNRAAAAVFRWVHSIYWGPDYWGIFLRFKIGLEK